MSEREPHSQVTTDQAFWDIVVHMAAEDPYVIGMARDLTMRYFADEDEETTPSPDEQREYDNVVGYLRLFYDLELDDCHAVLDLCEKNLLIEETV